MENAQAANTLFFLDGRIYVPPGTDINEFAPIPTLCSGVESGGPQRIQTVEGLLISRNDYQFR